MAYSLHYLWQYARTTFVSMSQCVSIIISYSQIMKQRYELYISLYFVDIDNLQKKISSRKICTCLVVNRDNLLSVYITLPFMDYSFTLYTSSDAALLSLTAVNLCRFLTIFMKSTTHGTKNEQCTPKITYVVVTCPSLFMLRYRFILSKPH